MDQRNLFTHLYIGDLPTKDNEQPNNGDSSLHLPTFWAENTDAWFTITEPVFASDGFDLVINALAKESLCTVLDLITGTPEDEPYG